MKFTFILLLLIAISISSQAQKQIKLEDASKHVGDSVGLFGKVTGIKAVSGGKLTLVNLGQPFPNQLLTVVVSEEVRKGLKIPLESFADKDTYVVGKVELYKGKPQIVLTKPEQLQPATTAVETKQ